MGIFIAVLFCICLVPLFFWWVKEVWNDKGPTDKARRIFHLD